MDPLTIFSAFIPVITDGLRGLFNKFSDGEGAKPVNVEEAVKLVDSEIRKLEALAKLDQVGDVSLWVNNIRSLMRPVVGLVILLAYVFTIIQPVTEDVGVMTANLAASVVFYLFGDRTYMHFQRKN